MLLDMSSILLQNYPVFLDQKPSANIRDDLISDTFAGLSVVMRGPILFLETVWM
jgi:hypothetical protein